MGIPNWAQEFQNELHLSNDRSLLLVGCGLIEAQLNDLIKIHLFPSTKTNPKEDPLFGSMKPLSSFSAQIEMGYRVGIYDANIRTVLNLLRSIRNDCAHTTSGIDLSMDPHANKILQIKQLLAYNEGPTLRSDIITVMMELTNLFNSAISNVDINTKNLGKPHRAYLFVREGRIVSSVGNQHYHPSHWDWGKSD